jgi:hypothetical protein
MYTTLILLTLALPPGPGRAKVLAEIGRDARETRFYTACVANLVGAEVPQLVVGGFSDTGAGEVSDVNVYEMDGPSARLRWRAMWKGGTRSLVRTLRAGDLDGDGRDEVVIVGRVGDHPNHRYTELPDNAEAQLKVLGIANGALAALAEARWQSAQSTHGYGLALRDLDGDGRAEVISGGFFNEGQRERSELRVWRLRDRELHVVARAVWGDKGKTRINAVSVSDLNGDGTLEIVTAGRTGQVEDENENILEERAELTAWRLENDELVKVAAYDWERDGPTRLRDLGLIDADGDGAADVIGVGRAGSARTPYFCRCALGADGFLLVDEGTYGPETTGEVRDVFFYGQKDGLRMITIGSLGLKPNRRGQLRLWRFNGKGTELMQDRVADDGDETRVRQLVLWPIKGGHELITIGFMRDHRRNIGQILSWGVAP